ncbi:MAG: bifunctional phosphoribosylaminoimidazolecarboxamide formyltransferase/IMP cyclohydrolase [bacterium]
MKIQRALISVSDKTGLEEFCRFLVGQGVQILSTGGTARLLKEKKIKVMEVSDFTGFPEMMDGRVKTLHPKIHGGLLHLRDNAEHVSQAKKHGIEPIDLVVVNLYPFEKVISQKEFAHEEAVENIDIGGPAMLRSAAKNYRSVTVVVDVADYAKVQEEMAAHGDTTLETRECLAAKVFRHTAYYDSLIASYLTRRAEAAEPVLQEIAGLLGRKEQSLRYGENPHQRAALYGSFQRYFRQIHGKELSYNNILDISAAALLLREFEEPAVAILKHTNPCGVASAPVLKEAWELAFATDRQAPFGGIIVVNKPLDLATARAIADIFSEVIIAPAFNEDAKKLLQEKKNLRLIENHFVAEDVSYDYRSVAGGGLLVQESDAKADDSATWRVVSKRTPTASEKAALHFGWKVVKHIKSNAIVYAAPYRTLGIGAGQMSRVDSSKLAVWKAAEAGLDLKGSGVASDAFFPFPDAVEAAAKAGATAVIQPGGSMRDAEVIEAVDRLNMAMIFTGARHFKH